MGYTHIELLPIAEHPFEGSWGYQVTNYYAPTSRFGTPDDFRHFIDKCHQAGIGVIMDWVPAHFPKDAHALAEFDGTDLYEHMDPRQGEHQDWGTLIFNFGRNEVRNFLIGNALFWLDKYHIDGLRVDAVASMLYLDYSRKPGQWIPNVYGGRENLDAIYFLKRFNEVCYEQFPGHHDHRRGINRVAWRVASDLSRRPRVRVQMEHGLDARFPALHEHRSDLSALSSRQHHLLAALRVPGTFHSRAESRRSRARQALVVMQNAGRRMAEVRQSPDVSTRGCTGIRAKSCFSWAASSASGTNGITTRSLDWQLFELPRHDGLRRLVQHLNYIYKSEPALWQLDDTYDGFEWIDFHDADNSVVSFLRKSRDGDMVAFVVNATPVVRYNYRLGVPEAGFYREIINTDAETYGGSNVGNFGGVQSEAREWMGREHSIVIHLPPLATSRF